MPDTSPQTPPWSDVRGEAWVGLLETAKQLTRALDAELEARHRLSLSGVELLARLAAAPQRCLRLSALAHEAGLSLSRVSRIVDTLERRRLVKRIACPDDARAVEAHLTRPGLRLARDAQATHFQVVQDRFLDQLSDREVATMARVFARVTAPARGATGARPAAG